MIIRNGISWKGTHSLINYEFIVETAVSTKPDYASMQKVKGDHVVRLWFPGGEANTIIFAGTIEECQQQVDNIFNSYHGNERTYWVPEVELL